MEFNCQRCDNLWPHRLGFLVGLTLKIVPVKPYVKVRYTAWESQAGYCKPVRSNTCCTPTIEILTKKI